MSARLVRVAVSLIAIACGLGLGFGLDARSAMPMSGAPACAMLGHGSRVCPMSAADHLESWEGSFRALPPRQALASALLFVVFFAVSVALRVSLPTAASSRYGPPTCGGPPGEAPLFTRLAGRGRLQRLTYG